MWASVVRASGVANVVFGVLVALSAVIRLVADDPGIAAWPALVGAVVGIFGLFGLYLAVGDSLGGRGLVALVLAMSGLALSVGQFYALTFTAPGVGPLGPLFPLGYGPFLFGFLLLGVLLAVSRELPRVATTALIAGAALNAAGFATPEIRLLGVVVFGAGISWIGALVFAGLRPTTAIPGAHPVPATGGRAVQP